MQKPQLLAAASAKRREEKMKKETIYIRNCSMVGTSVIHFMALLYR
jgi:hypothetical protein